MFEWLKKMFGGKKADPDMSGKKTGAALPPQTETAAADRGEQKGKESLPTRPCRECGKAIPYDPAWRHLPNFCPECREKYRKMQKAKDAGRSENVDLTEKRTENEAASRAPVKKAGRRNADLSKKRAENKAVSQASIAEKNPESAISETEAGTAPEAKKKDSRRIIRRICKSCGRPFTFPSTVPHWPRYCRECRKNYRREQA